MKKIVTWGIAAVAALGALAAAGMIVSARTAPPPDNLGVRDGTLAPCPDKPNCVSSASTDAQHSVAPIPYTTSTTDAKARILQIAETLPRATLLREEPDYLHFMFRSPTVGFPDDTEFYFDEAAQVVQVRSAARLGQSDLDKNRERVEQIRAAFEGR